MTIKIDDEKVAETTHERDRVWNQTFQILCAHPPETIITITLRTKTSILGRISIPAIRFLTDSASLINGFFPLCNDKNGKPNKRLKLQYILWFKPAENELSWETILANNGTFKGLKNATFPLRTNCRVKLYQDAHHNHTFQPPFAFGVHQTPGKLWEDVYKAIDGAKHLIYIAGWSLNPKLVLVSSRNNSIVLFLIL